MKNQKFAVVMACISAMLLFSLCSPKPAEQPTATVEPAKPNYGGFETQEQWGEHLVIVGVCDDCHTPKKMTEMGPVPDMDRRFMGHPSADPHPDVNRKDVETKGQVVTNDLTAWVGPWGISYTGNISSDATGIGNWQEENFVRAIREGKLKGLESGRPLLPPMPWQNYKNFSDDELKAIFAFLKSTKPMNNVVPQPEPPVMAKKM